MSGAGGVAGAGRARAVAALGAVVGLAVDGHRVVPAACVSRGGECGDGQDCSDLLQHGFLLVKGPVSPEFYR